MQISIRKILFPTDFSESSQHAKKYAFTLASALKAELHVLNVTLDPIPLPGSTGIYRLPQQELVPQLIHDAKLQLSAELPDEVTREIKIVCSCKIGNPVRTIMDYAELHAIDLIVLGTHGRTGLSHVLIGSVAENVVRLAKCPVLTVHPVL